MKKCMVLLFAFVLAAGLYSSAFGDSEHPSSVETDLYYTPNYNDDSISHINTIEVEKVITGYDLTVDETNHTVTFTSTVQIDFISIKVSNGFIVYAVDQSNPYSGSFSYDGLLGPGGQQAGFSHATLFTDNANVPIPPAALLMGSGLVGLVGVRRKLRK